MLDASGLIHVSGDEFLAAEDEVDRLRFFKLSTDDLHFEYTGRFIDFGCKESDFESIAYDINTDTYFVIGSYSKPGTERLLRFKIKEDDKVEAEDISFEPANIMKKNINIEALTVYQGGLLMGLRSPKISGKAAAIIFNPDKGTYLLARFDLGKRIFRDITKIDEQNYLILAGPKKGRDYKVTPPRIYWWDGNLVSPKVEKSRIKLRGCQAEGICTRVNEDGAIEVLVGTDESRTRQAKKFKMLYGSFQNIDDLVKEKTKLKKLEVVIGSLE